MGRWKYWKKKKSRKQSRETHHATRKTHTVKPFEFLAAVSENGIAE